MSCLAQQPTLCYSVVMAHKYVDLENETACPYCRTTVPAGGCLCPSCGAAHMSVYRGILTPLAFFIVGWMVGDGLGISHVLAGVIAAVAGAYFTKRHADRNPKWVRGSW